MYPDQRRPPASIFTSAPLASDGCPVSGRRGWHVRLRLRSLRHRPRRPGERCTGMPCVPAPGPARTPSTSPRRRASPRRSRRRSTRPRGSCAAGRAWSRLGGPLRRHRHTSRRASACLVRRRRGSGPATSPCSSPEHVASPRHRHGQGRDARVARRSIGADDCSCDYTTRPLRGRGRDVDVVIDARRRSDGPHVEDALTSHVRPGGIVVAGPAGASPDLVEKAEAQGLRRSPPSWWSRTATRWPPSRG